jgi:hypothetical protein
MDGTERHRRRETALEALADFCARRRVCTNVPTYA